MVVGICSLVIYLPHCHSLKEKRSVLRSLKDRLRARNISIAEVDSQDLWQRAVIGIAAVGDGRASVEDRLRAIVNDIENRIPGEIVERDLSFV